MRPGFARATGRVLLAAFLYLPAAAASAEERGADVAAMRLAALAERIAKLHAQAGQGVLAERSRRALPEAMREFEATLRQLAARPSPPEVREGLLLLQILWREYRAWAARAPTRENARKLAERAEEVQWVAAKAARQLHERPGPDAAGLAFDAAKASLLSQRIPRLRLFQRWGLRDAAAARELAAAQEELRALLESLRAAPANTPEIAAELQVAESQFMFLARATRHGDGADASRQLEFAAKTGDNIFESMERVARLYEALAR